MTARVTFIRRVRKCWAADCQWSHGPWRTMSIFHLYFTYKLPNLSDANSPKCFISYMRMMDTAITLDWMDSIRSPFNQHARPYIPFPCLLLAVVAMYIQQNCFEGTQITQSFQHANAWSTSLVVPEKLLCLVYNPHQCVALATGGNIPQTSHRHPIYSLWFLHWYSCRRCHCKLADSIAKHLKWMSQTYQQWPAY